MTINEVLETTHDRWHWLGLPPSYEASMRFPGSREQISQACLEAVRRSGFRVRRSDLAGGWVEGRARISIWSWGEKVYVYLHDENQVHVSSECWWPMTVIDWGKKPLERQADHHQPVSDPRRPWLAGGASRRSIPSQMSDS